MSKSTKKALTIIQSLIGSENIKFVEPFNELWRSRGRVIYIRDIRSRTSFASYLEKFKEIESVQESGSMPPVYKVKLANI